MNSYLGYDSSPDLPKPEMREKGPDYDDSVDLIEFKKTCFNPFRDRLEESVDADRHLPDIYAVASTAMEIGLSSIEESRKDSMALLHDTWLENGKTEKLKETLLENMAGVEEQKIENLEELEARELLETYRRIEGRTELGEETDC